MEGADQGQGENLKLNIFPTDLQNKPYFQEFLFYKYSKILDAARKSPLEIMKTPKIHRTEGDL